MSAVIRQLVARKRTAEADAQAFAERRDAIVAEAKGAKGDPGPMPAHEWKGTKLRFEQPDGEWGAWVDLRGKPGTDGLRVVGGGGSSAPVINAADTVSEGDEMLLWRGGQLMRVAVTLYTGEAPAGAVTVNGQYVMVNGQFVVNNGT